MSDHSKYYDTIGEMLQAAQVMHKFQKLHNIIRKDYIALLRITEKNKDDPVSFDALYRASLRSLFSLIEADISGLNSLDKYEGFNDTKEAFLNKFKKTYKQIARTWKKEEIQEKYFSSKIKSMVELRRMRDELIHPKTEEHIHAATLKDFEKLSNVFHDYDDFVNSIMNSFFVGTRVPITWKG